MRNCHQPHRPPTPSPSHPHFPPKEHIILLTGTDHIVYTSKYILCAAELSSRNTFDLSYKSKSLLFKNFISFTPQIRHYRHHDADIPERSWRHGWLDRHMYRQISRSNESKYKGSFSESDQSSDSSAQESADSSESRSSEESSKEVVITQTTRATTTRTMTTDSMITFAVTDVTTGEMSTSTLEPEIDTDRPVVAETTPPAGTPTTPAPESSTGVTHCVTKDIPTEGPITENRGDN